MSAPTVGFTWPSASLIRVPPAALPAALPPPTDEATLASPVAISTETYRKLLSPFVPITIAVVYATTAFSLNAYNKSRENKPWSISKTKAFFVFVLVYNVVLTIYSAFTFAGMFRAVRRVWPGLHSEHGFVDVVDALCKIHGPRGLGNAAAYNPATSIWELKNKTLRLGTDGSPDSTDLGRFWNEGLAFWGWLFYLSKLYEILDTFIILAKGKRSSTLQIYHHAGAMFGMWAGIRYMSPPIWLFVFLNSGIHALMYTYYTLCALGVRVPQSIKRTLTTMQISQFVIGASFAGSQLFVSYYVPVSTPHQIVKSVSSAVSLLSSAVSSGAEDSVPTVVSSGVASLLKKLALRAADQEGIAENVDVPGSRSFQNAAPPVNQKPLQQFRNVPNYETVWKNGYEQVPCIDTSGETFAILLNIMYLLPLTVLFVRFFVRSYTRRTSKSAYRVSPAQLALESGRDAAKKVDIQVETVGENLETEIDALMGRIRNSTDKGSTKQVLEDLSALAGKAKDKGGVAIEKIQSATHTLSRKTEVIGEEAQTKLEEIVSKISEKKNTNKIEDKTVDETTKEAKEETKDEMKEETRDEAEDEAGAEAETGAEIKNENGDTAKDEIKDESKEEPEVETSSATNGTTDDADETASNATDSSSSSYGYGSYKKPEQKTAHEETQGLSTTDSSKDPREYVEVAKE